MRKFKIFFILSIIFIYSYCYADEMFDVRKVKWGMNEQEVINSELPNEPVNKKDNLIAYKDTIADKQATVVYIFDDNKLKQVIYGFENFDNQKDEDLLRLRIIKILENKYKSEEENPLVKGLFRQFHNDNTSVLLMTKKNQILVTYESIKTSEERKKNTEIELENSRKEYEKKLSEDSQKF